MKYLKFFGEARDEMMKVVWPNRPTLVKTTRAVFIFFLALTALLGVLNFSFSELISAILRS